MSQKAKEKEELIKELKNKKNKVIDYILKSIEKNNTNQNNKRKKK